jgi:dipeptidase E
LRLLLTSSGFSNQSIADALQDLVGKLPAETKIGMITTAANVELGNKDWFINQFLDLWRFGYTYIDIVDPSASGVMWRQRLADCDVVFFGGGNTFHLLNQVRSVGMDYWMNREKENKVFVGGSAGSILVTPTIEIADSGPINDENLPEIIDLTAIGWVDFEIEPHTTPETVESIEQYADAKGIPVYAIDDQTAIKVVDGTVEVVSEGFWKAFNI